MLKILSELEHRDFSEPDSETLTSDARYSNSIYSSPGPWGGFPLMYIFCSDFDKRNFTYIPDDFKKKKISS